MALLNTESPGPVIPIARGMPFDTRRFDLGGYRIKKVCNTVSNIETDNIIQRNSAGYNQEYMHLDMYAFAAMWAVNSELPEWLRQIPLGQTFFQMYFGGTKLINEFEVEHVLLLRWGPNYWLPIGDSKPRWHWGITPINYDRGYKFPYACVSTINKRLVTY